MALADEEINQLITSFLSGEASPGDAMVLEDWKRARRENQELFEKIRHIWQEMDGGVHNPLPEPAAWEKLKTVRQQQKRRQRHLLIRIAAVIITIVTCGYFVMRYTIRPPEEQPLLNLYSITTPLKDTLPDKSFVEMGTGSSLQYYATPNRRRVVVKGRSWFHVTGTSKHPFEVDAGALKIKVLGTIFQVVNNKNEHCVSVTCGSVLVISPYDSLVLKAGQSATYFPATAKLQLHENIQQPDSTASPRMFHFVNSSLAVICRQLSDAYGTRIILGDSSLQKLSMSADFRNEPLDNILNVIAATLSIHYHYTNDSVILHAKRTP